MVFVVDDVMELAILLKGVASLIRRGMKCVDTYNELTRLERLYEALPDKRRRPGPLLRKTISNCKSALLSNNLRLCLSLIDDFVAEAC
mmetsp:Transcript_7589/g.16601  ORF Transcript_7589/g.16601 Transcript_7589/m.16601 type:complete len:88 (-) Transcript_7589:623-886(-)